MQENKLLRRPNDGELNQYIDAPLQDVAWYTLDGEGARLFRPGERIHSGERLGAHSGRTVIHRDRDGVVVSIQYDVWRDQVIVGIAPAVRTTALGASLRHFASSTATTSDPTG